MRPFKHQSDELAAHGTDTFRAIHWEQGTGKTKLILDTMAQLARAGEIDGMLVVAPNGVHRNWIEDEIPLWAHSVQRYARFWTSSKAATQRHQRDFAQLMKAPFPVVAMTYDGFVTKRGKEWAKKFLTSRKALFVLDEATAIKSPSAKRTKTFLAAGKYAKYRRTLTGTPVTNGPFDVYAPLKFLSTDFWKQHGFPTFTEFKQFFGIWEKGYNSQQQREYDFVVGYRNLGMLQDMLAPVSSRVTKDEVLDLPPKLYSKRYFELSPEQARVYKEIQESAMTLLATGDLITVPLAITRLLRAQQVTCNYMPTDHDPVTGQVTHYTDLSPNNPRLECLRELLEDITGPAIIWARFTRDIDLITDMLGAEAVRYDGQVTGDQRAAAKARFQSGGARYFVANPAAGATGLTLTQAKTVIYYNNSFHLEHRLQSEDRAHRIGQDQPVNYIDIMAPGTVDVKITAALRNKVDIASSITGDNLKEWI